MAYIIDDSVSMEKRCPSQSVRLWIHHGLLYFNYPVARKELSVRLLQNAEAKQFPSVFTMPVPFPGYLGLSTYSPCTRLYENDSKSNEFLKNCYRFYFRITAFFFFFVL